MMKKTTSTLIKTALEGDSTIDEEVRRMVLSAITSKDHRRGGVVELPVMVSQKTAAKMLSCSRFHVRKLERKGILKPVSLDGLKRFRVNDILKLS